jgi:uncharacterized membrane protein YgcG
MFSKLVKASCSLLLLLASCFTSFAQEERITQFHVQVQVNKDRSISVKEDITVIATGQQIKRGITRNFPTHRMMNGRSVKMDYQIKSVQKNGREEPFFAETNDQGYTLYAGQKEVFLQPGTYRYVIDYDVPGQIGFFEGYDEIYWNAIGHDVIFPIDQASCILKLPPGVSVLQEAAYLGYYGEKDKAYTVDSDGNTLTYTITRALQPQEGFSVAVGFPKGVVAQPGLFERYGTLIVIIGGLLFLFPYFISTWMRYGQDPQTPASYPIWNAPDNLSAASINYIFKEGYQQKSFTASLIDLAIKGYLRIEEQEEKGFFTISKSYQLHKLKNADEKLFDEERRLFNSLFSGNNTIHISGDYQPIVESAYQLHRTSLGGQHHHFVNAGNNLKFIVIPILVSFLIGALAIFLFASNPYAQGFNLYAIGAFVLLSIIGLLLYTYLIKKPTVEKLELQSRIKGFQLYLDMAEKDRLNLLNPPEMTPQHFEEVLPYAFALDLEHKWSEKFKTILEAAQYRPEWNNSSNPAYFYSNFGNGFSKVLNSATTKPSSSGGSGSGGGGFSGGGGGGGGVGGW